MVAVEDCDRLGKSCLLVSPQHRALLVVLGLRLAHLFQLGQEILIIRLLLDGLLEERLLGGDVTVVGAQGCALLVEGSFHGVVLSFFRLDESCVSLDCCRLVLLSSLQICRKGFLHALQNADDTSRARHVDLVKWRCLLEQGGGGMLQLLRRQEGGCGTQGLAHAALQLQQISAVGLVAGHEATVCRGSLQGLVGTDVRKDLQGLRHLVDGCGEVGFLGLEALQLFFTKCIGLVLGLRVLVHAFL
mmetsp:Transcript_36003/g.76783  ORF Transcript_36003/g.76783 Transcript_36003/m.76783 type:complete len:245 (-) Transcript_36003:485-1219(-)